MCEISKVTVKDLPKINELENQLNLNKTKLKKGISNLSTNLVLCYKALIKNGFFEKNEVYKEAPYYHDKFIYLSKIGNINEFEATIYRKKIK